ncbi:modulator of drug activity B [Pasteurella testudinis DSM 23072]|uniref:Modulator of drug activity B n=1 Tax=Pasteurella testudinis DSM 23072 TaxID=1122938 RepID=A0A1W1V6Z5_9PAST|nr:NAD(P)H-dependent oxidoreductase [Pasteurella testudinis]SMB89036.1 modulator of drug activity B [Pasteurella testudinis DSM 23072]SUB50217.1 Modulator of drug activity B [Pasteurella testudinis]
MNILILNGHQPYPVSEGRLTQTLIDEAEKVLTAKGHSIRHSNVLAYDINSELDKHDWADALLLQFPSNWMMIPWSFKKYMDEVYSAGTEGRLCRHDGRTSQNPHADYGSGGVQTGKKYMLSTTFNAPKAAFDNPQEYLFQGKGLDDLHFPVHCVYRSFGYAALPSFACFDVLKNPQIEQDLLNWAAHLEAHF